ncbi:hypothetical protein HDU67_007394 [Dinochytrium kinnereticum]|nr:hypothetical protein HDU67_007394 [Dinochytrium kinnereticum]
MHFVRPFELPVPTTLTLTQTHLTWTSNLELAHRPTHTLPLASIYAVTTRITSFESPGGRYDDAHDADAVSVLVHCVKGGKGVGEVLEGVVEFRVRRGSGGGGEEGEEVRRRVLEAAGLTIPRTILAVVNPRSSQNGETVFSERVAPALSLAGVEVEVLVSEKPLKMMGVLRGFEGLDRFSGILVCGGDGIVHEVINVSHAHL